MPEQSQQAQGAATTTLEQDPAAAIIGGLDLDHDFDSAYTRAVKEMVKRFSEAGVAPKQWTFDKQRVDDFIAEIDQQLSAQINEILHSKDFQKLVGRLKVWGPRNSGWITCPVFASACRIRNRSHAAWKPLAASKARMIRDTRGRPSR